MIVQIQHGEKAAGTIRKVAAANQNALVALKAEPAPQWYDVKFLAERMVDMRGVVRDAIIRRRNAQHLRVVSGNSRGILSAQAHGMNMDIALAWSDYREATAAYHASWTIYQKNLRRF